jgi:capsular polysaccharide biosynthesis protein
MFLNRSLEGVIFDYGGIRKGFGHVLDLGKQLQLPDFVREEDGRITIESDLLRRAPRLSGNFAIFYNRQFLNHYHWLIDGLLNLFLLRKMTDSNLTILFSSAPESAVTAHHLDCLQILGFGDMALKFSEEPIVQLESASWIHATDTHEDFPAQVLLEFQASVAASVQASTTHRRIYIERKKIRSVQNGEEVRQFLEAAGFLTVRLEEIPFLDQIRLFAGADFIVAPHGAGLSNLVFAPPDSRVIEFMPDAEMRPFFWMISNKLGHEYGMIRCQTDDGTFNGKLNVDMEKLRRLFSLLEKA